MLRNYLTTALRTLRRHRGYTAINVAGLALGMTACLLIGLYIRDELSYDRFHEDADALFVLGMGESTVTPYPLADAVAGLPDVRHAVRLSWTVPTPVADAERGAVMEERVVLADPNLFEAFTFPLRRGDPAAVLTRPDAAVVTASAAERLFGEADPVGRTLKVTYRDSLYAMTVTGVAEDVPDNSTITFDVVLPMAMMPERFRNTDSWGARMYRTYARLATAGGAPAFSERMRAAIEPHRTEHHDPAAYFAVPLPAFYLSDYFNTDGFRGQVRYLFIFGAIAVFILLIAGINYVNLVTAMAARRAKEVGVRKTMGASRAQLARQFMGESVALSAGALVVAVALTSLALPAFNHLFDTALGLRGADDVLTLAGLAAFVLVVGVAAGLYPAAVLARFDPAAALRGARRGRGRSGLRRSLVVVQFGIATVLLVGTLAVFGQLRYMQNESLGFAGEQVAYVELPRAVRADLHDALRRAAAGHPAVLGATVADALPGGFFVRLGEQVATLAPRARTEEEALVFAPAKVDAHYVDALGLELVAGRTFDPARAGDRRGAYVLNRAGVAALGWTPAEAVGQPFTLDEKAPGEVIGVIEDFHLQSLHEAIEPVVLMQENDSFSSSDGVLAVRLAPEALRAGVAHLERVAARFAQGEPVEVAFLDDRFDAMYRSEERLGGIFTVFAGVAILIACLGLFGLASFVVSQRTKEIGIRKVLGATVPSIVVLLAREFVALVAAALVVGAPVGYLLMDRWLADFAYRITLGPGLFALAAALAFGVAALAVSGQSLRAALTDPVHALRYE